MTINKACLSCKSSDIRRCAVIHAEQSSSGTISHPTNMFNYSVKQSSNLSKMLAPPYPPSPIGLTTLFSSALYFFAFWIIVLLIDFFCQEVLHQRILDPKHGSTPDTIIPISFAAIVVINAVIHYPKRARRYQEELNKYQDSWFCNRCGTISILNHMPL